MVRACGDFGLHLKALILTALILFSSTCIVQCILLRLFPNPKQHPTVSGTNWIGKHAVGFLKVHLMLTFNYLFPLMYIKHW